MPDTPDEGPSAGENQFIDRRSGKDRRDNTERRHGGRRFQVEDIDKDRRKGDDRRKSPRRRIKDRRRRVDPRYRKPVKPREGPEHYSADEIATIQRNLSQVGFDVRCPACGGAFSLGELDRREAGSARQVRCDGCGRSTVVTNCVLARVMVLARIETTLEALRKMLVGAGHEIVEPPNPRAALDVFRDNPADVVIMDSIVLEKMRGQDFIRRLHKGFPDAGVIVLSQRTSFRQADPSVFARRLGNVRVIRMPFTLVELLGAIREARR